MQIPNIKNQILNFLVGREACAFQIDRTVHGEFR